MSSDAENQAWDAVRFVDNALRDPVPHLNGTSELHTAFAPHLRNWVVSSEGRDRNVLMVSAVGSVNYDLVVETSDVDMKAVYLPAFEDFFYGKFPKFSLVTDEFDCELHPAQHFVQHVLKGNINFFEPLYAGVCLATPDFIHVMKNILQPMVEMNIQMTALACYFTAEQSHKGTKYGEPGELTWKVKKGAMAIRILTFLVNLLDTGKIDLKPTGPLRDAILRLKRGDMGWAEYVQLYDELHQTATDMTFTRFNNGGDFQFSDRVAELDGTNTSKWNTLQEELNITLMKMVREPIEQAHRNLLLEAGWKTP